MGCSASKNVTITPSDASSDDTNGIARKNRKSTAIASGEIDLNPGQIENTTVNNVQTAGSGLAFEITFDEGDDKKDKSDNTAEKHLPKRILELQESENREPVTLEKLQEKLEEAEIRRQQILQQRSQSANLLKRMKNNETLQSVGSDDEPSPNHLKVPKEVQPHPTNPYDVAYT